MLAEHKEVMRLLVKLNDYLDLLPIIDTPKDPDVFKNISTACEDIMIIAQTHNRREEEVIFPLFEKGGLLGIHKENTSQHKMIGNTLKLVKEVADKT